MISQSEIIISHLTFPIVSIKTFETTIYCIFHINIFETSVQLLSNIDKYYSFSILKIFLPLYKLSLEAWKKREVEGNEKKYESIMRVEKINLDGKTKFFYMVLLLLMLRTFFGSADIYLSIHLFILNRTIRDMAFMHMCQRAHEIFFGPFCSVYSCSRFQ